MVTWTHRHAALKTWCFAEIYRTTAILKSGGRLSQKMEQFPSGVFRPSIVY